MPKSLIDQLAEDPNLDPAFKRALSDATVDRPCHVEIHITIPQRDQHGGPVPDGFIHATTFSGGWIDRFRCFSIVSRELPFGAAIDIIVADHRAAREHAETERKCAYCRGLGRIATNSGEP